ncbi:hypothetical protein HY486_02810 [Candidatus Woesearchaeota archaeon]|nr:hypothetical protein [Candidatus Woesearchaeota archaeon]
MQYEKHYYKTKNNHKAQISDYAIWIIRIGFIIIILMSLFIAKESIVNTKTSIAETETKIIAHTLMDEFPQDLVITTQNIQEIQTKLDKIKPNFDAGAIFRIKNNILRWGNYKTLSIESKAEGFSKNIHSYKDKFPATLDNQLTILEIEVHRRA